MKLTRTILMTLAALTLTAGLTAQALGAPDRRGGDDGRRGDSIRPGPDRDVPQARHDDGRQGGFQQSFNTQSIMDLIRQLLGDRLGDVDRGRGEQGGWDRGRDHRGDCGRDRGRDWNGPPARGHWETVTRQVLVEEGRWELQTIPAQYEVRRGPFGRLVYVCVRPAETKRVWIPPKYECRTEQVWVTD